MPITSSAKKALRQSIKKRSANLKIRNALKDILKEARVLTAQKKTEELKKLFPKIQTILDKAAKNGTIKKNTSSRKKSRIAKFLSKAAQ